MSPKDYLLALCQCPKLGPSRLKRLRDFFDTWENIWKASVPQLQQAKLENPIISELISLRKEFNIENFKKTLVEKNIRTISVDEINYPSLLKQIYLPPPLLYYQGSLDFFKQPTIAVVGTRQPSYYGKQVANSIVRELTKLGFIIISGLAVGIDGIAHTTTLNAQGNTIAVLGSGLNCIYPSQNKLLAKDIIKYGCLISEFSPDTPPHKSNFPRRNRIIAGLAQATLVIEASKKSGALITAHYALQENRDVMAIPGNIFSPLSQGTNDLIKQGASLITDISDIISILRMEHIFKKNITKQ